MYQCVCHSCDEEDVLDTLENAQTFLNEHAELGHEVEFVNVTARSGLVSSDGESDR